MNLDLPAGVTADQRAELESLLATQRTLGDVLDWGKTREPPVMSPVVVTQDEYTHDVVVPFRDGLHLVYDTT